MIFKSRKQYRKFATYFQVIKKTEISFEKQVPIPWQSEKECLEGYLKGMEKYYNIGRYGIYLKSEYYHNRPTVPLVVKRIEIEAEFYLDGRKELQKYRSRLSKKITEIDYLLG